MAEDLNQLVQSQAARIRELESKQTAVAIDAALSTAVDEVGANFAPGARSQFLELIRSETMLSPDGRGGQVVTGPGLAPVKEFVTATLARPEYGHFVKGGGAPVAGHGSSSAAASVPCRANRRR